jgi:hypothetical protein
MRWTSLRIKQKQKEQGDRISAAIEIEINRLVSKIAHIKRPSDCAARGQQNIKNLVLDLRLVVQNHVSDQFVKTMRMTPRNGRPARGRARIGKSRHHRTGGSASPKT